MRINNVCTAIIDFVSADDARTICKNTVLKGLALNSKTYTLESWSSFDGVTKYIKQYRVELVIAYPNRDVVRDYINATRKDKVSMMKVLILNDESSMYLIDM